MTLLNSNVDSTAKTKNLEILQKYRITTRNGERSYSMTIDNRGTTISMENNSRIKIEFESKAGEGDTEPFVKCVTMSQRDHERTAYYTATVIFAGQEYVLANNGTYGIKIVKGPQGNETEILKTFLAERKLDTLAAKTALYHRQHPDFDQIITKNSYRDLSKGKFY